MGVQQEAFTKTDDGQDVSKFTIEQGDLRLVVMDFGATLMECHAPDRDGQSDNIVLSHNSPEAWLRNAPCFGGICGRFANRIAKGQFSLNAVDYQLATNNGPNHLHGGEVGFHRRLWTAEPFEDADACGVCFAYLAVDGEEGYPGDVEVTVEYSLNNDNELVITYEASTTKATPINLTNHAYWNLRGLSGGGVSVEDQHLRLFCDQYLPVDETAIPTGEFASVKDTVMDFTSAHAIGEMLHDVEGRGYDHCFVINGERGKLRAAATAFDPQSGRIMEVATTEPGVQFYTGNFLLGDDNSSGFSKHQAFCLEAQTFPNAPNEPNFAPLGILNPGEQYAQTTVHRFSVE
ncbi:MAG: aldose epimerase family protein [Planctomycetaceae bacterium]